MEGFSVGLGVGFGFVVGFGVGLAVGFAVALAVGFAVAFWAGLEVAEGFWVAFAVGFAVGFSVALGVAVGFSVGLGVGLAVSCSEETEEEPAIDSSNSLVWLSCILAEAPEAIVPLSSASETAHPAADMAKRIARAMLKNFFIFLYSLF